MTQGSSDLTDHTDQNRLMSQLELRTVNVKPTWDAQWGCKTHLVLMKLQLNWHKVIRRHFLSSGGGGSYLLFSAPGVLVSEQTIRHLKS